MKKRLFSLIFLPILASNTYVKSEVKTSASGDNVNVHSEAVTIVNGEETKVTSDQPGEIKIEVTDNQVNVITKTPTKPTTQTPKPATPTLHPEIKEVPNTGKSIPKILENLVSQIAKLFNFRFFKNLKNL